MTCSQRMITHFHCCVPHQRLQDALEIMGEEDTNWVAIVAQHDQPEWLGWVTSHDAAVFLGAFDKRPSEVMCREVLSAPPVTLDPEMELSVAYERLRAAGLRRLPVVSAGRLVGELKAA
jgi:CBS domain-containing protein